MAETQGQTISLGDQIKAVAQIRQGIKKLREEANKVYAEWEQQHNVLLSNLALSGQQLAEEESLLRELTIKAYRETGSKSPAPGVGIREMTKLEYDAKEAFNWAIDHKIALSLDKRSFETFAKATPLAFVDVYQEVQATIATDLEAVNDNRSDNPA
jgi:hypothetical protein